MKTFHLKLVPDNDLPQFKRLHFEEVDISFTKAMQQGIHIRHDDTERLHVLSGIMEAFNQSVHNMDELTVTEYAKHIDFNRYFGIYIAHKKLEYLLEKLSKEIYFVESLSYQELLQAAKERLQAIWSNDVAESMLKARFPRQFDDLRIFLKTKDQDIKLQGYEDLKLYEVSQLVTPDDFQDAEKLVIQFGLECHTFRHVGFLPQIVNEDGLLKAYNGNRGFFITCLQGKFKNEKIVPYRCTFHNGAIRFVPGLHANSQQRQLAQDIAAQWRRSEGKFCFHAELSQVEKMLEQEGFVLSFTGSVYGHTRQIAANQAAIKRVDLKRYHIGALLTDSSTNAEIKAVLKQHNIRVGGRKEALLERLIQLCVQQYEEREAELTAYFSSNRFIRIKDDTTLNHYGVYYKEKEQPIEYASFPLLEDSLLRNQILAMFVMRHMRGNVIVDGTYLNETCSLQELAKGLIQEDVRIHDSFVQVV